MRSIARRRRRLSLPVLAASLALVAGCNSKDESSNPAGTSNTEVTSEDVALSAVDALGFANEFVTEVRSLAAADFSSVSFQFGDAYAAPMRVGLVRDGADGLREGEEILYDETAGAWVLEYTESETTEEGTATASIYFFVQYLNGVGAPQVEPDETTASMNIAVTMDLDAAGSDPDGSYAVALDYGLDLSVAGMPAGPYEVTGGGNVGADFHFAGEGGVIDFDLAMAWLLDVHVPAAVDGCPTGAMSMTFGSSETADYEFAATYSGTPSVAWTLEEGGVAVDSGTETLECGTPAL